MALAILVALTTAAGVIVFAGPVSSGAIGLLFPTDLRPTLHGLPADYRPRHDGRVDLATGRYIREDDDFVLTGTPPIVLTRTYVSGDRVSRQFGIGTTNNGELSLAAEPSSYVWAELTLADGARVRFERVSSGRSYMNALFEHRALPPVFVGARLGWVGFEWVLRFQNGSRAIFQPCGPMENRTCSLIEMRDADNHRVLFKRDRLGALRRIEAGDQWIVLDYDDRGRIVRGHDSEGRTVSYAYDDRGRLRQAATADGIVRKYAYGVRDEMLASIDPDREVEITFDAAGRSVRQVARPLNARTGKDADPSIEKFAYSVESGSVVQTRVTEADGSRSEHRFNASHYTVSERHDRAAAAPVTVAFDREPATNVASSLTVTCSGRHGPVRRTVWSMPNGEEAAKQEIVARECR